MPTRKTWLQSVTFDASFIMYDVGSPNTKGPGYTQTLSWSSCSYDSITYGRGYGHAPWKETGAASMSPTKYDKRQLRYQLCLKEKDVAKFKYR